MAETFNLTPQEDFTVPPVKAQPLRSFERKGDVALSARMMDEALSGVKAEGTYNDIVAELGSVPESERAISLKDRVLEIREAEQQNLGAAILGAEGNREFLVLLTPRRK